ncbi:excisionase family DNA binding protein [Blastococcus colisei]|uniref:Excisionase family DNA binding protein n=1 Tax=Blastococcus colisei TaxID=1564162 RepID=A0A543PEJ7_9ACTN|nr:excisionase family DNA binding protein [Blastococcus colisei]
MTLPQRSPAPALSRPAAYGQRPANRSAVPGPRPTVQHSMGARPMVVRPGTGYPMAAGPVMQRPAPRAAVSFLTVTEVASIMRVSKMTVYRLVHGGELAAVRVGRSFRVPEPAVREYLAGARTDVA